MLNADTVTARVRALVAEIPEEPRRARLEAALVGTLLRVDPAAGRAALPALDLAHQRLALEYRARSGAPPEPVLCDAAAAFVRTLPPSAEPARAALALWAGLSPAEAGLDDLEGAPRAEAVKLALAWGVPASWAAAASFIAEHLEGAWADHARLELLTARPTTPAPDAVALAARIEDPLFRLRALAELAPRLRDPQESNDRSVALARTARAALDPATEPIEGVADAWLAGVLGSSLPVEAGAALDRALARVEDQSHPEGRGMLLRAALYAAAGVGIHPWRGVLQKILSDHVLLRDVWSRGHLLFEAASSAAQLPGEARGDALGSLAELPRHVASPAIRATLFAALALASAAQADRSPAPWLAEIPRCLDQAAGDRAAATVLPKTARLLAALAPEQVAEWETRLSGPVLRVLWLCAALEGS